MVENEHTDHHHASIHSEHTGKDRFLVQSKGRVRACHQLGLKHEHI
jgi:hypothetical protein